METSGGNTEGGFRSNGTRRYGMTFSAANLIQAPLSAFLEYSGLLRGRSHHHDSEATTVLTAGGGSFRDRADNGGGAEVSIRIIGAGEQEHVRVGAVASNVEETDTVNGSNNNHIQASSAPLQGTGNVDISGGGSVGSSSSVTPLTINSMPNNAETDANENNNNNTNGNGRDTAYQRYDIQQLARYIEQILPFSLLLLVVFIRQHLQGFFVTFWIAAVMIKSNDILRKQTALKGERKISVLIGIILVFVVHVVGIYWWYRNVDLLYPLVMLPPKKIPPFWHAMFIIVVNDTMVRQAAMVVKCGLLIYYKNSRGRNYRKQGQMLTLVEYILLLYRALLPTPVWYRFFLNKDYGSLFSSLTTGLYLTFKLTSIVEKVQSFFAALKALSRKEVQYGSYASMEEVLAAGDLCAICQEKMHAPILLRCKHIFCEECVSEWFERERTCPLCRALVKPADLRSFGDGSTSLFFQLF